VAPVTIWFNLIFLLELTPHIHVLQYITVTVLVVVLQPAHALPPVAILFLISMLCMLALYPRLQLAFISWMQLPMAPVAIILFLLHCP
jgi:hypothetical protein